MPWGRLDDSLYDHPKLDALGKHRLAGVGLNTLAMSWSNRYLTDGFVPRERVLRLGGTYNLADALVTAGLWEKVEGGFRIHDFLDYNDSRDDVRRGREAGRERMRYLRSLRRCSGEQRANNGGTAGEVPNTRPLPSIPVPIAAQNAAPRTKTVEKRDPEIQRMLDLQAKAERERGPQP